MRIGIMGMHYGHIRGMLAAALAAPNAEVVGMVEPDDKLYEDTRRRKDIRRFPCLSDMLEKAKPQLILEGCTHAEKAGLVELAAAAGAHVLLDKPLCRSFDDWERMHKAVATSGIKLSMWYSSRSYPPFMALRESVLAGDLGDIVSMVSTHPHKLGSSAPRWYFNQDAYAGTFHDLGCHGVDQIRWLSGAEYVGVHALSACKKHTDPPLTDHVQASFRLSDGSCAVVTADWLTPQEARSWGDTRFIIMGTEGSAHLRAYAGNHLLVVSNRKGTFEPALESHKPGNFVQDMINALERGDEHFIATEDVFAVAKACLVAEESVRQGGRYLPVE